MWKKEITMTTITLAYSNQFLDHKDVKVWCVDCSYLYIATFKWTNKTYTTGLIGKHCFSCKREFSEDYIDQLLREGK